MRGLINHILIPKAEVRTFTRRYQVRFFCGNCNSHHSITMTVKVSRGRWTFKHNNVYIKMYRTGDNSKRWIDLRLLKMGAIDLLRALGYKDVKEVIVRRIG